MGHRPIRSESYCDHFVGSARGTRARLRRVVVPAILLIVYSVAIYYYQLWSTLGAFGAEDAIGRMTMHALPALLVSAPIALFVQLILIAGVLATLSNRVTFHGGFRIAAYASLFQSVGIFGVAPWIAFVYACIRARVGDDGHPAALAFAAAVVPLGSSVVGLLL